MMSAPFSSLWILRFSILTLTYYITGLVGLSIPFVETHITLIWAPAGIALAALLRWGLAFWPAVWLGALGVNLWVDSSPALSFGIACGNTLGPVVGAWLLQRRGFDHLLSRRQDLMDYLLLGVAASFLITSLNGTAQLWFAGILSLDTGIKAWSIWWLGDAMGALVCGIPLLTFRLSGLKSLLSGQKGRELVLGVLLLLVTGTLIFTGVVHREALYHPILYLPFFILSWLAIRGGVAIASFSSLLLSIQAVLATAQGSGPFLSDNIHFSLAMLWGYMATATIIPVLITVLVGELRVSERRLGLATLGAELGVWEWSLDDDRISHAHEISKMDHFFAANDGQTLRNVMHPEDVNLFNLQLDRHLSGQTELFEAECRFNTVNDEWIWLLMRGQVVEFLADGKPVRMAGTLIDTTDRKQAEAALLESRAQLQQSEERYRQLLSNSPVGILNYDQNLRVTYVNTRFAEIMGVPIEYMQGLDCHTLKDQSVVPALSRALHGETSSYEGHYCTSYGQLELWISMNCAPVTNGSGDIVGGIALIEDITARKGVELELLKFKFFSDNASDMHMLVAEDTAIRYANRLVCERLGYSQDVLQTMVIPDIDQQHSKAQIQAFIERCKQGWIAPFETEYRCKDGTLLPVEITTRAHQFNGEWLCFSAARDISDRKAIEARERRQRESLTALNEVAALWHLPLNEQLQRALKIGGNLYGLEFSIVSEVIGQTYRVLSHVSPPGTLTDSQCFELGDTYCDITLTSGDVVAISDMQNSDHYHHPCYRNFRLETYLGAPVYVGEQVYGTVNFSSAAPYSRTFDEGDREFMRLLARWIGSVITLAHNRRALAASEERLKTIIDTEPECVKVISPEGEVTQMNRAGLEMLGADSLEEVNRVGVLNLVDPEYREAFDTLTRKVLQGESGSLEFKVTGQHGRVRWLDTHAAPLRNSEGQITAALSVTRDITLLKGQQQKLEQLAHYDGLTGLPNRTLLAERMEQSVVRARRREAGFAVCYLDLDGFKAINDELGHDAGDRVLRVVSRRLTEVLREVDTVARLGGDEFVLILSDIGTHEECTLTLGRVLNQIAAPIEIKARNCLVSASIGIALYPEAGEDPDTLLRHSDQAMYAAKQQGKNGYRFYQDTAMLLPESSPVYTTRDASE